MSLKTDVKKNVLYDETYLMNQRNILYEPSVQNKECSTSFGLSFPKIPRQPYMIFTLHT